MIAFFGAGLLGSGFVRALLGRGEQVHVWNRSPEKARVLEAHGARAFDDPAAAAEGAERVHLALSDDDAVDAVLERAARVLTPEVLVVDHTTTSPSGTKERVRRWDARGVRYVHAPVFMGPQHALEAKGLMLVCGERARVAAARPALEAMTGSLVDLGERVDQAAAFKLLGNLFLMFVTGGLTDFFALAKALDVEPRVAASLFEHFNPGATLGMRIERMLGGEFERASWGLAMARKDARLMLEEAEGHAPPLRFLPRIAARMDELIAEGHGADDWTVLAKDAIAKSAEET